MDKDIGNQIYRALDPHWSMDFYFDISIWLGTLYVNPCIIDAAIFYS